ncbi:MAG: hypothetical protein FJ128_07525 [Deltaproteobacteria bacterium]|nr:hypothetical protein [Deltaproteobacteria bacterium]
MLLLFALALFLSATLLFMVQPLVSKMFLPLLGGSPAVWNTCMVFFQAVLLAGYAYSHLTPRWLGVRRQAVAHLGLLLLIALTLPLALPSGQHPPTAGNPIPWLLLMLALAVGLPFFILSTTAPLLQKWFAHTTHTHAGDPYFLYGASNLGSMTALAGYLVLVEPYLPLGSQARFWSAGYGALAVLVFGCAVLLWRSPASSPAAAATTSPITGADPAPPTLGRRLYWVLLALVPSSLMLGVTNHITTDIAAVPLLWVIPMALYLLTFVLVFARRPLLPHRLMVGGETFAVLLVAIFFAVPTRGVWLLFPLHLAAFFLMAMVCHGELMKSRPDPAHLTEFYLWLSVGGVLGGIFNALVAPVAFSSLVEYPLAIVMACLLRPSEARSPGGLRPWLLDLSLPLYLGLLLVAVTAGILVGLERLLGKIVPDSAFLVFLATTSIAGLCCSTFRHRPLRFGLGVAAIMMAGALFAGGTKGVLFQERNFFGVLQVREDAKADLRFLTHGTTLHGAQSLNPARRGEPLTYFTRSGPLGQVFDAVAERSQAWRIGVIGLGVGTIAAYGRPGQEMIFYEIDPAVERVARDPRLFTFLQDCPAKVEVVLGDGRLSLQAAPPGYFDMLIMDAFSSDAVPVHLLTREALQLYFSRLKRDGLLIFNISNHYLDLGAVLASLSRAEELAFLCRHDLDISETDRRFEKAPSSWAAMARQPEILAKLAADSRWQKGPAAARVRWTDDFSNILAVFQWRTFKVKIF